MHDSFQFVWNLVQGVLVCTTSNIQQSTAKYSIESDKLLPEKREKIKTDHFARGDDISTVKNIQFQMHIFNRFNGRTTIRCHCLCRQTNSIETKNYIKLCICWSLVFLFVCLFVCLFHFSPVERHSDVHIYYYLITGCFMITLLYVLRLTSFLCDMFLSWKKAHRFHRSMLYTSCTRVNFMILLCSFVLFDALISTAHRAYVMAAGKLWLLLLMCAHLNFVQTVLLDVSIFFNVCSHKHRLNWCDCCYIHTFQFNRQVVGRHIYARCAYYSNAILICFV